MKFKELAAAEYFMDSPSEFGEVFCKSDDESAVCVKSPNPDCLWDKAYFLPDDEVERVQ